MKVLEKFLLYLTIYFVTIHLLDMSSATSTKIRDICDSFDLDNGMYSYLLRIATSGTNKTKLTDLDTLLQDLLQRVGLSRYVTSFIPDPNHSVSSYEDLNKPVQRILTGIVVKVMDEVTQMLFPADPEGLRRDIWDSETDNRVIKAISDAAKRCKQRSLERRILNAALAGNLKRSSMYGLVHGNEKEGLKLGNDNEKNKERFEQAKLERRLKRSNSSPRRSMEFEIYNEEDENMMVDGEQVEEDDEMHCPKRRKVNGGFSRMLASARKDWTNIFVDGANNIVPTTRVCISDTYIKDVIRFIFREDHVQFLSCGTRRVRHNGELKIFPDILRKVSKQTIWENYVREVLNSDERENRTNTS